MASRGVRSTRKIAPLLGGDVGEPPLHQRLTGGDELDDGRVAGLQVALDAFDQRRRLHGRDQVVVGNHLRLPLSMAFRFA